MIADIMNQALNPIKDDVPYHKTRYFRHASKY